MDNATNPYYLKSFDDFYSLHPDIQEYLKEFFLDPVDKTLIKTTTTETIRALIEDWEDVEEDSRRDDQKYGHKHKPILPSRAAQKTVVGILKLFNSALAILFRSDWGSYQEVLFDSWIPIGVERPSSKQDMIRVLNWPTDCFEKNTYVCTSDTLKVLESGLTLCLESGNYVLFWKQESYPAIPLDRLVRFDIDNHTNCTLNLWEDDQIKTTLSKA